MRAQSCSISAARRGSDSIERIEPPVAESRGDRGRLDPRPRAEIEHALARLRVEQRNDRLRAARLRHQLAGRDPGADGLGGEVDDDPVGRIEQRPGRPALDLDPGRAQLGRDRRRLGPQGVDPQRRLGGLVHRRHQQVRLGLAELAHQVSTSHSGYEWAIAAPSGVESSSAAEQLLALGRRAAQDRVDEARGGAGAGVGHPAAAGPLLRELDRLVDRRVVGRLGIEELVEAEAQRRERGVVDLAATASGEDADQVVARRAALDRAVGEPARLRAVAALEALAGRGGVKARSVQAPSSKVRRRIS